MESGLHSEAVLTVGNTFESFDSLQKVISDFEASAFVQLYVRSSRTLQVQRKRAPRKTFNEALQFGELDYACINGGRNFKSKSTGKRPNQSTFQMACPFHVKVRTTADGQMLVIKSVHLDHNHEVSQASYCHLPRQRQMDDAEKEQTLRFLRLKADKKFVQQHIREETGKVVTLKDLHNLIGPSRSGVGLNLQDVVSELEKTQGGAAIRVVETNGVLDAVFYQRHAWREIYQLFPEIVLIDATYKINNLGMPLYVMMVVDGNGESQVVAVWIVRRTMISIFKDFNEAGGTRCFMADKDWVERGVIREEFPEAALLICLFHTMRTFRREVTEKSMGCTSGEKNSFLEILQKMVYSHSEDEYMKNYQDLQATGNRKLQVYFDSNWHSIRKEWVEGMKVDAGHLLNRTNNRLESINQKIKSVVDQSGNLAVSIKELLLCFDSLDQERQHRATLVFQKVPVGVYAPETPVTEYQRLLTPHAFAFVQKQFELSCGIVISADQVSSASVNLQRSEGLLEVSTQACTCGFFKAVSLPCRHIFAVRSAKDLSLFDGELCAKRWTKSYYRGRLVPRDMSASNVEVVTGPTIKLKAVPSQNQRYRTAFEVARRLASLASELPLREFRQAVLLIEQIATAWQEGKKVVIEVVDPLADSFGDTDSGFGPFPPPPAFCDTLHFGVPGPPPGFTDNLQADLGVPGPPPGFTDNLQADLGVPGPPPGFTDNLQADLGVPGPPPGFTDNLQAESEEPGPSAGSSESAGRLSVQPGSSESAGRLSVQPGSSESAGRLSVQPGSSESAGRLSVQPGSSESADRLSVEPGFSESAGRLSVQPGSSESAGRLSVQPGSSESAGRLSVQPGSSESADRLSVEPGFSESAGRLSVQPGSSESAGRLSVQPGSSESAGRLSVQPGSSESAGRLSVQPGSSESADRLSVEPGFSESAGRLSVQPGSSESADRLSVEPGSSESAGRLSVQPGSSESAGRLSVQPGSSESADRLSVQPGSSESLPPTNQRCQSSHLSAIKLPPKSIKRGRPKGSNITVIGLPAKKQRACKGPYSFIKLGPKERELMVLSWIFGDNIKTLYSVGDIPASARDLPKQIIDENVHLDSVKKYFDRRAWVLFLSHVASLRKDSEWLCCMCKEGLDQHTQALGCDSCLQWFHFKCVGVKSAPKSKYWFCSECKSKN